MSTKLGLIMAVANRLSVTKKEAEHICEQVLDAIAETVEVKGEQKWPGFGTFKREKRAARKGRNPWTGETIDIPAKNAVTFTPASDFKARIQ